MAISYPLDLPTTIGFDSCTLRAVQTVSSSKSPFTQKQQTFKFDGGDTWELDFSIPAARREYLAPWKAFLISLKGQSGTFLAGDPDYQTNRGNATSLSITGNTGAESVTATLTGTLLAGDYFQVGTGLDSRLHTVLQDITGDGTLEIFPGLRSDLNDTVCNLTNPRGLFRLRENIASWSIDNSSRNSISFTAIEAK